MLRCPECGARRLASGLCPRHGGIAGPASPTGSYARPPVVRGFTLQRRIGVGGHGAVWSARRGADGRPACIKLARPSDPASLTRWLHEIACQRRAGPAIAAEVLGSGTTGDGMQWFAMARVQAETLATTIAARPVPWSCAAVAAALAPVIASVDALHREGIVHGDLKPENVIVACGRAVLLDFGSASTLDADAPVGPGTAEYVAPERCTTPPCMVPASDVYALAAIAYELLTGTPPFFGPDEIVLEDHRSRRPVALQRWGLPSDLDAVLRAALAKDPSVRTASAAELASALLPRLLACGDAIAVQRSSPEPTAPRRRSRARVPLLWLRTAAKPTRVQAIVARHEGALVHQHRGEIVAAFPGSDGADSPIAAARALLADAACERVLIDVDEVALRHHADGPRVFSPWFGSAARYLADDDPSGLAFTTSATELASALSLVAMPHRADRFVPTDIDVPPMPGVGLRGRDALLDDLHEAAAAAERGLSTLATITGEPGSGRTRVAEALAERLRSSSSLRVVHVHAPEPDAGGNHGCAPVLLRALLELPATHDTTPRSLLAQALHRRAEDVPLGLLVALDAADPDDPAVAAMRAAPGAIRISIAAAIADAIVAAAGRRPLAIVIDDADRADAALLDALESATLSERSAPLLVVAIARGGFVTDRPDWSRRAGRSIAIELPPLELEATAELVREGLCPAPNVPDAAIAEIHRRTRGLPLLLVELLSTLRQSGALRRISDTNAWAFATDVLLRVPDMPLAAWMAGRELDRLPRALARHAAVVAAMGPDTEPAALEAVLRQLDSEDAPLPTVLDPEIATARLVAAGILRRDAHAIAFRHEALRERAAARLDADATLRLHRAALASQAPMGLAARLHHAIGAAQVDEARRCALELATLAGRRHAYLEAERYYAVAHAHADAGSELAQQAQHGRGLMRFRLGRHADAREDLAAVANAPGPSAARLDALLDAATVEDWCEEFVLAEAFVTAAEGLADEAVPVARARLALARGRVAFRRGRMDDAVAELTNAADLARDLGDDAYETRVIALLLLAPLLGMTGQVERSLPMFDELFALCEAHCDRIHLATALLNRPFVWMELGRRAELVDDLERVIALSRAAGFPLLESRARYNLGELAYLVGDVATALREVEAVVELELRLGGSERLAVTHLLEARCRLWAGERPEAHRVVRAIREQQAQLMPSDEILCHMVELACEDADASSWAALVARSESDSVQQEHIEVLELAGLAAGRRGEHELARTWLERALEVATTIPTVMRARVERSLATLPAPEQAPVSLHRCAVP